MKRKTSMRKALILCLILNALLAAGQEYQYYYIFFDNSPMPESWFFSKAGANGGSEVKNDRGKLPVDGEICHTPGNSLLLQYKHAEGGTWHASVFYQALRGVDFFRQADVLSLWLYNPAGPLTPDELPRLSLMRRDSSLTATIDLPSPGSRRWQQVRIPLGSTYNLDPDHPERFIAVVFSHNEKNSEGTHTLYIDDIEFLPETANSPVSQIPVLKEAAGYALHVDLAWEPVTDTGVHLVKIYRSNDGKVYNWIGIQKPYLDRFADFTGETGKSYFYRISFMNNDYNESGWSGAVQAQTRPMNDDELLTMVQEACFRFYWEGAEPVSGMAREDIPGRRNMIATGASGFGIMALIVGTERNFITRDESVDRFLKILGFLEKADRFHGVYGHFMDGPTGKVEPFFGKRDNGADLVETAFLMQGLLAARQYFSEENEKETRIREQITEIWETAEWDWFRKDKDSPFLYWHWSPDQEWVINHPLVGWNETMVVYLLAISSPTHHVPARMYYSGWAGQDETALKYRRNWGGSDDGSLYINGKTYFGIRLDVGVNNGGPLFFTHYSYMGYDPHFINDKYTNYFENNRNIAMINHRYCVSNPHQYKGYGEGGWGLTASDGPYDYSADEPISDRDFGKLAPTGAIGSFPYTPEESMKALKNYYYNYGHFLWGEYGFKDAFNLTGNWCSEIYMGLNQAPMVVMIENYRTGLIWRLFMQNEEIQKGLKKLEEEGR